MADQITTVAVQDGQSKLLRSQNGDMVIVPEQGEVLSYDAELEKKVLRKIDMILLPMLLVSYVLQFLDKTTLGYAAIMGIITDLSLTGSLFSWASSIFYFGYLAFSQPVGYMIVRLPIGKFVAGSFCMWSIILMCMGAVQNYQSLLALRFLLGMAEATISPAFSIMTGMFYKRSEQPFRHGLWFAGNSSSGIFGGLIAYGISHITGNLASWRWLFIIFGIISFVWSIVLAIYLPDSPLTARFLNEHERIVAIERVRNNETGIKNSHWKMSQMWEALRDPAVGVRFFDASNY